MKRLAVGLCLAGVISTAVAVNWVKVFDSDGLIVYVDPNSIKTDDAGYRLIWTYGDYSQKPITNGNMTATTMIERVSVDCKLDRYQVLSLKLFDHQGNLLGSPDMTGKPFTDIPPGSASSFVEAVACHSRE
ncbi:surface-adhesin E family protein [Paraburkholderia sp. BL23I1N1]|uniref:surface-adhesin E family protein n=1 Tax=Paraburkholderia sp. BL23I1N1 TaxID=1938802 RepID=UPI001600CCAB|nr:surface-adhesin E family protein [Paraburkholderia sp. BL23I1N1]